MDSSSFEAFFEFQMAIRSMRAPFADGDSTACAMADDARRKPVDADEAQAAEHPLRADDFREKLTVPEPILEREDLGIRMEERS